MKCTCTLQSSRSIPHLLWSMIVAPLLAALVLLLLGGILWRWSPVGHRQSDKEPSVFSPTYIGKEQCAKCHAKEAEEWSHSDHALAMQKTTHVSVLGNFNDRRFTKDGVTSSFYKKDGKFYARTDGPDGKLQDYELPYTFGYFPLQQYLVPFPNGRLQSLVLAWDSRAKDQGGQRWFHLYPNQKMPYSDPLHWTRPNQTWNFMCADCHSTNLRPNYDLAKNSYDTTWSEINVSCEQCHGPGSQHATWAQTRKSSSEQKASAGGGLKGLVVDLKSVNGSWWLLKSDDVTLHWKGEPRTRAEFETCAPCHSRRRPITSHFQPGQHFLDAYVPNLLEEDYEYGSFVQSKMYHEGVTCSDCHDPHTGKLPPVSLNQACGKCHLLAKFGAPDHHHHKEGSTGALCVNCHMPTRTYMVVDVRRDHSFRVPRPDFSVTYGTPNACTQCHKDKPAKWAAAAVAKWYGTKQRQEPHFVAAIDAGRRGSLTAEKQLAALISDSEQPGIARATALSLLPQYVSSITFPAIQAGLSDADALVRREAIHALEPLPPRDKVELAGPLLADPFRSVRIEAARLLAGTPTELLKGDVNASLERATAELIASEMAAAERPESHINLALLYTQMGRTAEAESELQTALRLDPRSVPAMVNLADLYRMQSRDDQSQRWLEKAIALAPDAAEPIHALGLLKARQKKYPEALGLLARAAALLPANVRYSYVYAVALNSNRQTNKAITVLERAHKRRPADRDVLLALVSIERDRGGAQAAIQYARELAALSPGDPQAQQLLTDLLKRGGQSRQ